MFYIMNEDGSVEKVDSYDQRWIDLFVNQGRQVAFYEHPNGVRVSTVFLGIDHRFNRDPGDPPILWETMIFKGPHDDYQERYSSLEEAKLGHARAVEMVKAGEEK